MGMGDATFKDSEDEAHEEKEVGVKVIKPSPDPAVYPPESPCILCRH